MIYPPALRPFFHQRPYDKLDISFHPDDLWAWWHAPLAFFRGSRRW